MNVRIFRATGLDAIGHLKTKSTRGLRARLLNDLEVKRTDTAMSQIVLSAAPPQAILVITIWWGKK